MKKFLVVLLSLGLIVAFSMPAAAADVTIGGQYYLAGVYDNNPELRDNGFSQAYFYQRVRLKPVFKVADGLTFTTQMDALEKQWGDSAWRRGVAASGGQDGTSSRSSQGAAGRAVQENIEFEQGYVTFNTAIGQVQIGYQDADVWGTAFGNTPTTRPRAQVTSQFGDFTVLAIYEKWHESTVTGDSPGRGFADADNDTYALAGIYKNKAIEAGLLYKYFVSNANRPAVGLPAGGINAKTHLVSPYAKMTFGPVFIEAEVNYMFGKSQTVEADTTLPVASRIDKDAASWSAYINGNVKFGPATVGGLFGFVTGGDFSADKDKGLLNAGYGWNPALILLNDDLNWYGGTGVTAGNNYRTYIHGWSTVAGQGNGLGSIKYNTILYNLYGAYQLTPKLGFTAAFTYGQVENKKFRKVANGPVFEAESDKLGYEFDVTATYKIFDNLSYMVGAGYLWAGDYFKFDNPNAVVKDNYVLLNKLTLNF